MHRHAYEKAAEIARKILQETPRDNGAWDRLVRAHLALHDLPAANQALAEWRSAVPEDSPKRDELTGDSAFAEENAAAAVQAWSKALERNPKNPRVMQKLARGYGAQRQWTEADAIWTELIALEKKAVTYVGRALCRRQMHRWSEALDDVHRAQKLEPANPEVQRSAQLLHRLEQLLAPIRELDARIAVSPDDDQLIADRALLFLRCDDAELALRDAEVAAKVASWAIRPRLFQAVALQSLGRTEETARLGVAQHLRLESLTPEFLETLARLDSEISVERNNPELYISRAWQLNDLGQPTLALEDVRTALERKPDSASAYVEESYALAKLGRADEAYAEIKRATELDPNIATAWDYRGELEAARNDQIAAIESFSRALTITPTQATLQKREQAYRKAGLVEKADEDLHALGALRP